MKNSFKDHFSGHANSYQKFRPFYPDAMFKYFASVASANDTAWDCATGNGQAAVSLAKLFNRVIATDASENQITRAMSASNVEYRVAKAEQSGLSSNSVDLITVAQALHWFDTDQFFEEAKRVLKPGGLLAVWWYRLLSITPEIDSVIEHLYSDILQDYWPEERQLIENGYRDIQFPFKEVSCPAFTMTTHWSLPMLLGYLSTWSAVRHFIKLNASNPVEIVSNSLTDTWGDPDITRQVSWQLTPKIGRAIG